MPMALNTDHPPVSGMSSLRPFDQTPVECANSPVSSDALDGQHTDVGIMPLRYRLPRPAMRRGTVSIHSSVGTL